MRKKLLRTVKVNAFTTKNGEQYGEIIKGDEVMNYPLNSNEFSMVVKSLYLKENNAIMDEKEWSEWKEYLKIEAYNNKLDYDLEIRVAEREEGLYYNLDNDTCTTIFLSEGKCERIWTPERMFKRTKTFKNQIEPDLDADIKQLPTWLRKHFNLKNEDEIILLTLYLVTCLRGLYMKYPMLVCYGEKGASKSTFLRMQKAIVDPENLDLMPMPKTRDDLQIRLHNSYFVTLDNLSYLSKKDSDLLATAISGSTAVRRQLYRDTNEILLNLHSIIAMNGIHVVARESDLLDRVILFHLERIGETQFRSEEKIWAQFNKDLPSILGASLQALAIALNDISEPKLNKTIRMVDWQILATKVGKAIGYDEETIERIIWNNSRKINEVTLEEDVVATCIIKLLSECDDEYVNSVSALLGDIQEIAKELNVNPRLLPQAPNALSRRLNQIKTNLEQQCKIFYEIKKKDDFREIYLWRE